MPLTAYHSREFPSKPRRFRPASFESIASEHNASNMREPENDVLARDRACHLKRQALPSVLIEHDQDGYGAPVGKPIAHEVIAPHRVRLHRPRQAYVGATALSMRPAQTIARNPAAHPEIGARCPLRYTPLRAGSQRFAPTGRGSHFLPENSFKPSITSSCSAIKRFCESFLFKVCYAISNR
jgi:hypothetical protein